MRRKTEEKRQQILDGAARVFEQRGYHSTTLADIAREVGCSKVTIYNYFESREELLKALIVAGSQPVMDYLSEQLTGSGPIVDRLKSFAATYLALVMNEYSVAMLRLMVAEGAAYDFAGMFADGGAHDIWRQVSETISAEVDAERLSCIDPAEATRRLRALLHGGSHYQQLISAISKPDDAALTIEAHAAVDAIFPDLKLGAR